jgi:hypothetical protein
MSEELVPLRQALEAFALSQTEEVLTGEIVRGPDIRWTQWWTPDRATTNFRLEVDDTWYQRVSRADWEELNRLALGLVELQRRTCSS